MFQPVFMCFSPYLRLVAGGGGVQTALVHNLLMQFFSLHSSKIEVSEAYFFDIVITSNDHPRYVKHVLVRIYVVFTLFGCWGVGHNLLLCSFIASAAQKWSSLSPLRGALPKAI